MRNRSHHPLLYAVVLTACGGTSVASAQTVITMPGNPIVGVAATPGGMTSTLATVGTVGGQNNYPAAESPPNSIDGVLTTKYLNFAQVNVGFIVEPSAMSVLTGFRMGAANDATERDPLTITIEGTNSPNPTVTLNSVWNQIYSGTSGLDTDPGRNTFGAQISIANATQYASYRVLVTSVRNPGTANSMQFSEIELTADVVPEPTSLALCGVAAAGIIARRLRRKA